ncbi:MAG: HD domain-containing protein [Spirochaetales bacterium]|nr:HD domain-containing protein [Spirochaetales bacterium]
MSKTVKFSIKGKILLIIIPLLICSFTISSYISVISSRKNIFNISSQFMRYRMEQLNNYAASQWVNLQKSGFSNNPVYTKIVEQSIESYARGMIRRDSEYIFAVDNYGVLMFSTADINYNQKEWKTVQNSIPYLNSNLFEYTISDHRYIGLSEYIPEFNWEIFIIENKKVFTKEIWELTYFQILIFAISLIIIILGLLMALKITLGPIQRIRKAIHDIAVDKKFSRKIKIEYPDEIGELAFEFNEMTYNLDLTYSQLKKYAIDEAIAKKEVFIRENETLDVLGKASEYKDAETGAHITRVSSYSLILSESYGLSQDMRDLLYMAAPLHDIGKLGVPDSILLKPGRLTPEEIETMKEHTSIGYKILVNSSSKYLKAGAVIAISHHEKFDGTGYPRGLEGEDIPVFGRIVSIADVFDALTTKRPYKDAWPFEKAVNFIKEEKGKHFDPVFVDLFIENLSKIRQIFDNHSNT